MPYLDGADDRIFYRHWSFTDDPRAAVVFLHGFGEHSGLYHRLAAELGTHGVDLWALDHRGHGLSGGDRGDVGDFNRIVDNAGSLADLAERSSPGTPLVIAGHSLGSLGAIFAALDAPRRYHAVILSGAPLSPLPGLTEPGSVDDGGEPFALDPAVLSSDPTYRDELENDPLAFTEADVHALLSTLLPPAWERLAADLPSLDLPVLAVHGSDDLVAPLAGVYAWRDRLPQLRVAVFDGNAHDVLNDTAHREVADTIAEFATAGARSAGVER
ncbi:lysophospholipase [Tsukamurella asaccharolytica]|uniref:Lysophospholipase n=1 Tax=Tsukamurella asaccharolytica TaxID=2592067 RepID=A0A5C5R644_9ACTN|nr:alpha/beta fold hydrolase [Tsukamurella asaccharolytica]TWS18519.1 lysophospholipase [Tsukamurella asaccharolytica]